MICSFMWADNYRVTHHSRVHLEEMSKDRWYLEPKPASLWWASTYDSEEKKDLSMAETGRFRMLFEDLFQGFTSNRQVKTQDGLEERMQNANKAWWRDANEDLQKQRRAVESEVQKGGGAETTKDS